MEGGRCSAAVPPTAGPISGEQQRGPGRMARMGKAMFGEVEVKFPQMDEGKVHPALED